MFSGNSDQDFIPLFAQTKHLLPIYHAQGFDKVLKGGSTHPWIVLVKVNGVDVPYVVKLYSQNNIDKAYYIGKVAKDVYSSVLAKELGLETPSPALIEFPDYFINGLRNEIKALLKEKNTRIKFGCKLIDGSFAFQPSMDIKKLEKYDIASIYAFDNLIFNLDRRSDNPNILLKDLTIFLIDHELALLINQQSIEAFKNGTSIYDYRRHIFHNFLKQSRSKEKNGFFDTFELYLRGLNTNILDSYFNQLQSYDRHIHDDYIKIKDYLCAVKLNPSKFINLLLGQIS